MKKLSVKNWRMSVRRALRGNIKTTRTRSSSRHRYSNMVTAWFGDRVERLPCLTRPKLPPKNICFYSNPIETLQFFDDWRSKTAIKGTVKNPNAISWVNKSKKNGQIKSIKGYVDYSKIEYISTAGALVVAAEYDRAARLMDEIPPTINLDEWDNDVFGKLYEIGFFEIVGLSENIRSLYVDRGDERMMRISSGRNAAEIESISEQIIELSHFIDETGPIPDGVLFALNSALSEGMINVSKHAYPADFAHKYQHVNSWWVTATANKQLRRLTIVMFDQGVTIPITLPNNSFFRAIGDHIANMLSSDEPCEYKNDALYIQGALEYGKTQTGDRERGLGLPQMKELIDICGYGAISIWSRGGFYRYEPNRILEMNNFKHSVGGTLIEWVIDLPGTYQNDQ
jgi:hypothetical protein